VRVCDKACIFCFFPIINKYLCMAKRSLLSERPSYFLRTVKVTHVFNTFFSHRFGGTLSITDNSKVYKPLVRITGPLLVAPLGYPIYNCHYTITGHFVLRKAKTKHAFWHHFKILTNVALPSGQNMQLGTDQAPNVYIQGWNARAFCGQSTLKLVLAFMSLSVLVMR
jgi:hypothetical protein